MSGLSYEYVWWPASEAYLKDQSVADSVFAMLKTKTPHAIYGGIGLEKPFARCIIAWDKTETHNEFIKSADYPILGKRLLPCFANPENSGIAMFHAHYDSDPIALFDAPVTEFIVATVKSGVSLEEAYAAVQGVAAKIAETSGVAGAVVGKVEEAPERLVILVGRKSREDGSAKEFRKLADGNVDFTVEVADLTKKQ